jgi:hypothetical protein
VASSTFSLGAFANERAQLGTSLTTSLIELHLEHLCGIDDDLDHPIDYLSSLNGTIDMVPRCARSNLGLEPKKHSQTSVLFVQSLCKAAIAR